MVFIIAEAGSNHNGSLHLAEDLIRVASKAGADSCKFQAIYTDELYLMSGDYEYGNYDIKKILQFRKEGELVPEQWHHLSKFSNDCDIDLSLSVFGSKSLAVAKSLQCSSYIKLASCDIQYPHLISLLLQPV